jgi:hypothetical protein
MIVLLVVLLTIGVLLLLYLRPRENYDGTPIRIALVSMIRDPVDLGFWIDYYCSRLGLDRLFLRIEDTEDRYAELKSILDKYPDKIDVVYVNTLDTDTDHYNTIQVRQMEQVRYAVERCRTEDISFLLHLDDDEILAVHDLDLRGLIRRHGMWEYDNIRFSNVEAVYDKGQTRCFQSRRFIRPMRSYANGKSMARLYEKTKPMGPHGFSFRRNRMLDVPMRDAVVLHFESCVFKKWFEKFRRLDRSRNVPFWFYKESMSRIRSSDPREYYDRIMSRFHKERPVNLSPGFRWDEIAQSS